MVLAIKCTPPPAPQGTGLTLSNPSSASVVVSASFSASSTVLPASWPFCLGSGLTCQFLLPAQADQALPLAGQSLNVTLTFQPAGEGGVGCGTTKAEFNINNPSWYDIIDLSLVDGYSTALGITITPTDAGADAATVLGPVTSAHGNEKAFGVFPLGCDICVARQTPSCDASVGTSGCKTGTQYNPDVPCQYQGAVMGGGGAMVTVTYLGGS